MMTQTPTNVATSPTTRLSSNLFAKTTGAPAAPSHPAPVAVLVAQLVLDERIQPRERIDLARRADYAERLGRAKAEGEDPAKVFPPLVVYRDGEGVQRVASGFHRAGAAQDAGVESLLAVIYPGGVAEARLYAAGTNSDHGLPRTEEDRRRVVMWFLEDPRGVVRLTPEVISRLPEKARAKLSPGQEVKLSEAVIGLLCDVSQPTVSRIKTRLHEARTGAAGSTH